MRVLFLDLDTLRPDHLGCYGYGRNTSPNLDSVAKEGVMFNQYFCSDAPCLPSRAALMSGKFGIHTGVVGHGGTAADMRLEGKDRGMWDTMRDYSLPAVFRRAGFCTASISTFAERHSAWWFNAGFNEVFNVGKGGQEIAEEVTPVALNWLDKNIEKDNWFLHINYWDAHTPYRAPVDFGNPFEGEPLPEWIDEKTLKEHIKSIGPHHALEISMFDSEEDPRHPRQPGEIRDMDGLRRMIDGYDCGINYMDFHVGIILDKLKSAGIYDDIAIIISADHGENQGELGIYGEHATADYATCRIPMIIKWPGTEKGITDNGLHYNLDLIPTVADMLGVSKYEHWDGESYALTLKEGLDCGREYLVLSQCAHVCQRGVRFGDWMYMRTYHDGFHLFDNEMLFNVGSDPYETVNLAEKRRDLCFEAVYLLNKWHDEMMKSMDCDVDPLWTVIKEGGPYHAKDGFEKYCKHLKSTGREWAVEELKKRHGNGKYK